MSEAQEKKEPTITTAQIIAAEALIDLTFTDAEREQNARAAQRPGCALQQAARRRPAQPCPAGADF